MRKAVSLLIGVAAALAAGPARAAEPTRFVFTVHDLTSTDDLCGFPITHLVRHRHRRM